MPAGSPLSPSTTFSVLADRWSEGRMVTNACCIPRACAPSSESCRTRRYFTDRFPCRSSDSQPCAPPWHPTMTPASAWRMTSHAGHLPVVPGFTLIFWEDFGHKKTNRKRAGLETVWSFVSLSKRLLLIERDFRSLALTSSQLTLPWIWGAQSRFHTHRRRPYLCLRQHKEEPMAHQIAFVQFRELALSYETPIPLRLG